MDDGMASMRTINVCSSPLIRGSHQSPPDVEKWKSCFKSACFPQATLSKQAQHYVFLIQKRKSRKF